MQYSRLYREKRHPHRIRTKNWSVFGIILSIDERADVNAETKRLSNRNEQALLRLPSAYRDSRSIHEGDADSWRQKLAERYASATLNKHVKRARQIFKAALRSKLIDAHPFAAVTGGSEVNDERKQFVDRLTVSRVIDACPDVEWKLTVSESTGQPGDGACE